MSKKNKTPIDDNEYINPLYGEMETRYGSLKVPEVNDLTEKKKKLIPILKEYEYGK